MVQWCYIFGGVPWPGLLFGALFFSLALLGLNAGAAPAAPLVSQVVAFPVETDFAQGSFVLDGKVQAKLVDVVKALQSVDLEVLVVKAFAGPLDTPLLALERARSVRAFFVLHGIAPERVYIESRSDDVRPHRFELDIVAQRTR